MLYLITAPTDPLLSFVKDDPVRPEISPEFRVQNNRLIATLVENDKPTSMVCISFHDFVPASVTDLLNVSTDPTTAVFYTIWSYQSGSGARLLRESLPTLKNRIPTLNTFVTLSPKTEMARRFHLKNGASILRENSDTINYHYSFQ